MGIAWQQAVNGRVRAAADSALTATLVNFAVGTVTLLVAFAIDIAVRGWPGGHLPTEPWLYLGGPIGIVFIAIAAAIVRFTGVLLLGLATIAGQIVGAVLLDLILPTAASHPGVNTLLGAALTMVAVLIAALAPPAPAADRPHRRPTSRHDRWVTRPVTPHGGSLRRRLRRVRRIRHRRRGRAG